MNERDSRMDTHIHIIMVIIYTSNDDDNDEILRFSTSRFRLPKNGREREILDADFWKAWRDC